MVRDNKNQNFSRHLLVGFSIFAVVLSGFVALVVTLVLRSGNSPMSSSADRSYGLILFCFFLKKMICILPRVVL